MENPEPLRAPPPVEVDPDARGIDSAALARLLEEVRNDAPAEPHAYNRMHNRHNR